MRCESKLAGVSPRLVETDPRARLSWIDTRLSASARTARQWTWGWGGGIAASGVASLAVVPFVAPGDRIDWYTSAGSAAIGLIPFLTSPFDVTTDAPALHRALDVRSLEIPAAEVCGLLDTAEASLARDAANQQTQRSPWFHVANLAFNLGVTLFLGLGFHHWAGGAINGIAGAAVGEAIIFTQPSATIEDLSAYRQGLPFSP